MFAAALKLDDEPYNEQYLKIDDIFKIKNMQNM